MTLNFRGNFPVTKYFPFCLQDTFSSHSTASSVQCPSHEKGRVAPINSQPCIEIKPLSVSKAKNSENQEIPLSRHSIQIPRYYTLGSQLPLWILYWMISVSVDHLYRSWSHIVSKKMRFLNFLIATLKDAEASPHWVSHHWWLMISYHTILSLYSAFYYFSTTFLLLLPRVI